MVASRKYGLRPEFERVVAVLCASDPKFFGAAGFHLDASAIADEVASTIIRACRDHAQELGRGPSDPVLIVQRLQRWMHEGSVTIDVIHGAIDVFDEVHAPSRESVLAELTPVLRRSIEADAVRAAMDAYGKRGDFDEVLRKLSAAATVGKQNLNRGMRLGPESSAAIKRSRHLDRLPFGIVDLDGPMRGGLPRGCDVVFIGPTGGGKSMQMSHTTASTLLNGYSALYATLELGEEVVHARVQAALTGELIDDILEGNAADADEKLAKLFPILGTLIVKDFPAKATTMLDIREWVKQEEQEEGHEFDLVVIDYGDKIKSHLRDDHSEYSTGNTVFEDFRLFVKEGNKWGVTASQAKRSAGKDKRRRIEIDDVADSMGKVRTPDTVITLTPNEDKTEITYFIGKNRYGRSDFSVGPIPHEWEVGRMVPGDIQY